MGFLGQMRAQRVGVSAPRVISSVGGSMAFVQPACSPREAMVRTRLLCILVAVPLEAGCNTVSANTEVSAMLRTEGGVPECGDGGEVQD